MLSKTSFIIFTFLLIVPLQVQCVFPPVKLTPVASSKFIQNSSGLSKTPFCVSEVIKKVSCNTKTSRLLDTGRISMPVGEFPVDTNVAGHPDPYDQYAPSIAFDGTNYLVVWQDNRNSTWDIYGARVSGSGVILDPSGIEFFKGARDQILPSVAFGDSNYLVVWQDPLGGASGYDIYGARVSPFGVVLDTVAIAISTAAYDQCSPAIAFDGSNYLVVWSDDRGYGEDIYGTRVTPSGRVLDPDGIPIAVIDAFPLTYPSIAFDGRNYLVVWEDTRDASGYPDIWGARITPTGVVLDTSGIPIARVPWDQRLPSVAFGDSNYLVVWDDARSGTFDIYGARVSPSGSILDPSGIPICSWNGRQEYPSVAFDGTDYFVTWSDLRNDPGNRSNADLYGSRVSSSGIVLDPTGIPISRAANNQWFPMIAFDDTNYLVTWYDFRRGGADIYASRVSPSGNVIDTLGFDISMMANSQSSPSIASDGTNYLAVWQDDRNGSDNDIYGGRISQAGNILDPVAIPVSSESNGQADPSVAFDGINYLVVWDDGRSGSNVHIYGTRVSTSGSILDSSGIAISAAPNNQWFPAVAFGDTNYLVVWHDGRNGPFNIYGARVTRSGVVLDSSGIAISTAPGDQLLPAVAFDGINYLVVWRDDRPGLDHDIYGARVTPSGAVLDSAGIAISTAANFQTNPAVAFDGTNYLVVWSDERYSYSDDIFGARVSRSGMVLDTSGIAISTASNWQGIPKVAFDGSNYIVVWEDARSGSFDIYGAKLNALGIVVDSFAVTLQPGDQHSPVLARGSGNQVLIAYSGWADHINNHPVNTFRIWGKFYPLLGIEGEGKGERFWSGLKIFPNPFSSHVYICCDFPNGMDRQSKVGLSIYDALGRIVKRYNGSPSPPFNQFVWNGKNDQGRKVPSGVYFVRVEAGGYQNVEKIVLLR